MLEAEGDLVDRRLLLAKKISFSFRFLVLNKSDLAYDRGGTHTGKDFGEMIIHTFEMHNNTFCQILFDKEGEFVVEHEKLSALEVFFEKHFSPVLFNDIPCLVNFTKN